ncbi:DUF5789 family protein [Haloterrigena alkaliphila]|uniref:DUF2795 domain-containing protein n=1 Tax=Haloterrigena alkaliphila TaxID=2816475 RepID=A0A8A2VEY8_9EURY|nr:hypothetical protein [Haloterrigena alkaliphila]QSW99836.1 hypothetical protein J0X25_02410 [Haloterrigena alkaliphila]
MSEGGPDRDRAQDRAEQRKAERAETTESILAEVERDLGEVEYPITSEELASEYASEPIDMPNETESLGSVFDRLAGEQFDTPEEVREAVYGEITGEAGSPNEANAERDLTRLDEEKQGSLGESGGSTY